MKRFLLTIVFGLFTALIFSSESKFFFKDAFAQNLPSLNSVTVLKPAVPLVDFSLTDTQNKTFTQKSLYGHWTLMFFGYAQCPEICPKTLSLVTEMFRLLPEKDHPKLQFVFVSLDPKSDNVTDLNQFLTRFNPNFLGLTGNEADIQKLAKVLRVHSYAEPELNEKGQKIIDHSASLMLINPEGRMSALFSQPHQPEKIAKDLDILLNN